MIAGALSGFLLLAADQAVEQVNWPKSFEGRWNRSASGCIDDEANDITISPSNILYYESEDLIRSGTPVRNRSVELKVRRNVADYDEPERNVTAKVRLTLSPDGDALLFDDPTWLKWDLVRCPLQRPN